MKNYLHLIDSKSTQIAAVCEDKQGEFASDLLSAAVGFVLTPAIEGRYAAVRSPEILERAVEIHRKGAVVLGWYDRKGEV